MIKPKCEYKKRHQNVISFQENKENVFDVKPTNINNEIARQSQTEPEHELCVLENVLP